MAADTEVEVVTQVLAPPAIVVVVFAGDILLAVPPDLLAVSPAVPPILVEVSPGIPADSDRVAVPIAERVEDVSDAAGAESGIPDLVQAHDAVIARPPDEAIASDHPGTSDRSDEVVALALRVAGTSL